MPEKISDKQVACAYLSHSGKPNHPLIRIFKGLHKNEDRFERAPSEEVEVGTEILDPAPAWNSL